MSDIKYETKVVKLGELVADFMESNILVFFDLNAPEEVADFSILHEHSQLKSEVVVGDNIIIDGTAFKISAIGHVANENLSNLGHIVLKFNGLTTPEMPGDICMESKTLPKIDMGSIIQIVAS